MDVQSVYVFYIREKDMNLMILVFSEDKIFSALYVNNGIFPRYRQQNISFQISLK